jgi:hypothetical protein
MDFGSMQASAILKKQLKNWYWEPSLRGDFFRVQGDIKVTKTNESTNLFGGASYKEYYKGRLTFTGANSEFTSRLESRKYPFFVDLSVGQIIPFYFHSTFKETDMEKTTAQSNAGNKSSSGYTPFRDGFNAGVRLGIVF